MASRAFTWVATTVEKGSFPRLRKWIWRNFYNALSWAWPDSEWHFMNYGYVPADIGDSFPLDAEDEDKRVFIGLYREALAGIDIAGKTVLEVGSGRGGGAAYIAKYLSPASVTGVDYSPKTVRLAKRLNSHDGLRFDVGDAEALRFPDESFDIVLSVESSHCYSRMDVFVSEAARVLKPGGHFCWVDLRGKSMIAQLDRDFAHPDLRLIAEKSLSDGVVRALDSVSERKVDRIKSAQFAQKFLKEFAGVKGSSIHRWLASGKVVYLARLYRKAGGDGESADG